jgi:signal transduction histidine kinase
MIATAVPDAAHATLVAIVAHELRYPLVPIRNAAVLLRHEAPDPDTVQRVAAIIERQANSMNRLLGDLVDVSRMQRGAFELRRELAPLDELLDRLLEAVESLASERGHTLSVSVAPQSIYLQMDTLRLCQALRHIISIAIRHTDVHGHIRVRAERDGAHAVVTVSHSGMVVPQPELDPVLYLARYLVEAHGGTVTSATPGAGQAAFTIRLPCVVALEAVD